MLPGQFIPLFERNGFIVRLDEYVWERACQLLRNWLDRGQEAVPLSINVSRVHVYNPTFAGRLINITDKYKIPRQLIDLELTESAFVENPEELFRMMMNLRKEGFRVSMDDFGAGYSSLNMLKNAQVDTIKLDRGFLSESASTEKGRIVVQYAINLAKELNLDVVAEGVETKEQMEFLLKAGCTAAQGFYFSKAAPAEQFETMLLESQNRK